MKLVVRTDDVGYSKVCNIGTFEVYDNGIGTSADVMLDTPGTIDALERLRNYPWVSVGWHTHFWGCPILGEDNVPTLYDHERKGFRKDIDSDSVSFDEALRELRAEIELCIKILGKAPDVGDIMYARDSHFGKALAQVHDEFHIVRDFMGVDLGGPMLTAKNDIYLPNEKWIDRKIFIRGLLEYCAPLKAEPRTECGFTDSIRALKNYDPIRFYVNDESRMLEKDPDTITVNAWHPGYVDWYVYACGDYSAPNYVFKDIRTVDVHALTSDEVKNWIIDNRVELINMRDALYGTNEYQNHLKATGSPLAV